MELPSETELETYGWMDRLPKMVEWVGPRQVNAAATLSRSVVNKDWVTTESIPRNKFLDDKLGLYSYIVKNMAEEARKLHDQQLASLIQANPVCYDGLSFFNSAHPVDFSAGASGPFGTFSNDFSTLALNPTNYGSARASMRSIQGRDGTPFGSRPSLLVVPPQLEEAGKLILEAQMIAPKAFGNMTDNVGADTNVWRNSAQLLVIDELQNQPKVWYLLDNHKSTRPFIVQMRKAPEFVYLIEPTQPNVFWNKEYVFGADARSAYDCTLPQLALRAGSGL